jgi:hypothetical protein
MVARNCCRKISAGEDYPERPYVDLADLAIRESSNQRRYILLLNNDTLVNGPSLDAMVDYLNENSKLALWGGIEPGWFNSIRLQRFPPA